WVQAKLLLRKGKLEQAAGLLDGVATAFPLQPPSKDEPAKTAFSDNVILLPNQFSFGRELCSPACQVRGELAIVRLAQQQYVAALDAFLRAGFWQDAAWVGEQVLSLEELKTYVDRSWRALAAPEDS